MHGRLDSCAHLFCLPCITKWAKVETRCPLCKTRFNFIQPEILGPGLGAAGTDDEAPGMRGV
jgi:hypothetical protein